MNRESPALARWERQKGYRFFKVPQTRIPFASYDEIDATIQYDSDLKALLYSKIMFIETAVKNISLERILIFAGSETISDMFAKAISSYHNVFRCGLYLKL